MEDSQRPLRAIFAWWTWPQGGSPNYSTMNVTLECPWAFRVSSCVDGIFSKELLQFLQLVDAIQGDWQDPRSVRTPDENLVLTCFECWRGEISIEVSLDSAWDDPEWTVQVRMRVAKDKWHEFAVQFGAFVAEGNRHRNAGG